MAVATSKCSKSVISWLFAIAGSPRPPERPDHLFDAFVDVSLRFARIRIRSTSFL